MIKSNDLFDVYLVQAGTGGYSRQQFLRAISYSIGAHSVVFNQVCSEDESIDESADNATCSRTVHLLKQWL